MWNTLMDSTEPTRTMQMQYGEPPAPLSVADVNKLGGSHREVPAPGRER